MGLAAGTSEEGGNSKYDGEAGGKSEELAAKYRVKIFALLGILHL